MLFPQLRNTFVRFLPFRNRRAPAAENRLDLRRRALVARNGENVANVLGQGVRRRPRGAGNREAKPADVVGLVVVAVPAAMILGEIERQQNVAWIRDGRLRQENGLAGLVSETRTHVDSPRRLVLAIDRKFCLSGHPALSALIIKDRRQHGLRRVNVGCGLGEFDLGYLVGRVGRGGLHLELGQRASPLRGPAGAAERQVRVVQQFQPEGRDARDVGLDRQLDAMLGGSVPLRQERAILHRQVFLAPG